MKKKWLSIFAAAIFSVGVLTACAEDDGGETEDQTEETTEETTEEESAE
ncbi:hypothetical protein [Gracilibacillus sp. JCM 18860]